MKINQSLLKFLLPVVALFTLFNACVEDDDFDVPQIPPLEEVEEIVTIGGSDAAFLSCLEEDFEAYPDEQVGFPGYENVTTYGTRLWQVDSFSGNKYLQLSAFSSSSPIYSYFVVPVNFDEADVFSFTTQDRFNNGDPLKIFVVSNYTIDGNIADATFQEITGEFSISTGNTGSNSAAPVFSGNYDLSSLSGNGYIAFKYESDATVTTTIHIDDIKIIDNDDADCEVEQGGDGGGSKGGNDATFDACLAEDFESYDTSVESFNKYENISTIGDRFWQLREFQDNKYIQLSAFGGNNNPPADVKTYFVVPVDFDNADSFSFKTKDGFNNGDPLTVHYTTDYTIGEDITQATLTDITSEFTLATGTSSGFASDFTASGSYDLASISGEGHIVFFYNSNGGTISTTMQIEDIMIVDADDTDCDSGNVAETCSTEDFEAYADSDTEINGYQIVNTVGSATWTVREFSSNKYIQATAFEAGEAVSQWFIMGVDFDSATGFSFDSKDGFNNGEGLTVHISTNYDEAGDPSTATWDDVTTNFTIASGTSSGFAANFTPSGSMDLSAYSGQGYIAFKYDGNDDGGSGVTTTYQVDNVTVEGTGTCTYDLPPVSGGGSATTILISEIADPSDAANARFLELYNYGSEAIDLSGWSLEFYANANTSPTNTNNLTGTIAAGETFVIAQNPADFQTAFGVTADFDGQVNSNGDDNFVLKDTDGNTIDIFGLPGEDGTGTDHEFADGRAVRNADIMMANPTYDASEWTLTLNVATTSDEFTPGVHPDSGGGGGASFELIITGVIDGPRPGGLPKAIEIFVGQDIADLSAFGVGSANNGGGSDGEEFTLSGSASAGDYIYVASEATEFENWFGFAPTFTSGALEVNGDDAMELFKDGTVIDTFGDINTDGTGEAWEYLDGWAYRNNGATPQGMTFTVTDWTYSGPNALDGETTNGSATTPFPVESFTP